MMAMRQTAFRLAKEHLAILDAIKDEHGLPSRSAALRFVVRDFARTMLRPAPPPERPPE